MQRLGDCQTGGGIVAFDLQGRFLFDLLADIMLNLYIAGQCAVCGQNRRNIGLGPVFQRILSGLPGVTAVVFTLRDGSIVYRMQA